MTLDWDEEPLASGLACYRARDFFEAHEHWEAVWMSAPQPEKRFLQSLIQVTVAFHHLSRGNRVGAASLLTRAMAKLEDVPAQFGGVEVGRLRVEIAEWLATLNSGSSEAGLPFPVIR